MNINKHLRQLSPAARLAALSLILCGLIFPLLVTGLAQVFFPSQANGSITTISGRHVGSSLVAQSFNQSFFFHSRPSDLSASGVDPDITLQDALSQIPRISSATGIPGDRLQRIVNDNVQRTFWLIGDPFVNVLRLNQVLIATYPFYQAYR